MPKSKTTPQTDEAPFVLDLQRRDTGEVLGQVRLTPNPAGGVTFDYMDDVALRQQVTELNREKVGFSINVPADASTRFIEAAEYVAREGFTNTQGDIEPKRPIRLAAERRTQMDLFVADLLDANPKDTRQQMEFPIFSISKRPDTDIRRFNDADRGLSLQVTPSVLGLATVHDKDILIYCASQIVAGMNRGREPGQTVRFTSHDLLSVTNRGVGGASYKRMQAALERLAGTRLKTNITTGGQRSPTRGSGFGLIDAWHVIQKSEDGERMLAIEIKLSDWFYRAVKGLEVLTLDPDYFRLKSPLDRVLYELARKHCGHQPSWTVTAKTLHAKTGSRSPLYEFRRLLKKAVAGDALPTYGMALTEEGDAVIFTLRRKLKSSTES